MAAATGWRSSSASGNAAGVVPPPAGARATSTRSRSRAGEAGRAQGGDHRDLVGGVLDGGEEDEQVAHRVGGATPASGSRCGTGCRRRRGPARAGRAGCGSARGRRCRCEARIGGRRRRGQALSRRTAAATSAASPSRTSAARRPRRRARRGRRRRAGRRGWPRCGVEGGVGGLASPSPSPHELLEQVVDPAEDGVDGAEVLAQGDDAAAEALPGAVPERDVGAAEAVDRLLGVADDQHPAGRRARCRPSAPGSAVGVGGGQGERPARPGAGRCPGTRRPAAPASARPAARRTVGVAPEQARREHEQVVEVEAAGAAALVGPGERERGDPRQQRRQDGGAQRRELLVLERAPPRRGGSTTAALLGLAPHALACRPVRRPRQLVEARGAPRARRRSRRPPRSAAQDGVDVLDAGWRPARRRAPTPRPPRSGDRGPQRRRRRGRARRAAPAPGRRAGGLGGAGPSGRAAAGRPRGGGRGGSPSVTATRGRRLEVGVGEEVVDERPPTARANSSSAGMPSSTSKAGGRPAASGCSARMRWAKPCSVVMAASSMRAAAAPQRRALGRVVEAARRSSRPLRARRGCGRGARRRPPR